MGVLWGGIVNGTSRVSIGPYYRGIIGGGLLVEGSPLTFSENREQEEEKD